MNGVRYYKGKDKRKRKVKGDKNMKIENIENTGDIRNILRRIDEELVLSHGKYNDEASRYLITGELIPVNESEKRLINDTIYLLNKLRLVQDILSLTIEENKDLRYNRKRRQMTVEESLGMDMSKVEVEGDK